jgi:hypothetical protein
MATSQLLPADVSRSPLLQLASAGYLPGSRPPHGPRRVRSTPTSAGAPTTGSTPLAASRPQVELYARVDAGDPPAHALHPLPPHVRRRLPPHRGHRWTTPAGHVRRPAAGRLTQARPHSLDFVDMHHGEIGLHRGGARRSSPAATRSSTAPGRPTRWRRVGHVLRAGRPRCVKRGRQPDAGAAPALPTRQLIRRAITAGGPAIATGTDQRPARERLYPLCRAWAVIQLMRR